MPRFSANLGFLWNDHALPEAIHLAKAAGFDAVECHWPYEVPSEDVTAALKETGLPMISLNTRRGDLENGEMGLAAVPGREEEAKQHIDEAIAYASEISALGVHVLAGLSQGEEARRTFLANLQYAVERGAAHNVSILIEPMNEIDVPEYFLNSTDQASELISEIGAPNLKLMFDCYHVQILEGDLSRRLEKLLPVIGHIQFASVPERGAPDRGEINFRHLFRHLDDLGYDRPLGAEYKSDKPTGQTLGWMKTLVPSSID